LRSLLHVLLILSLLCSCSQKEQIAVFPDGQKLYDSSLEKQTDLLADPVLNGFVAYIRSEFGDFQKLLAEYADSLFDSDMDTALLIMSMAYSHVEIGFSLFYSIDRRSRNESIFSWSFNDLEPDEPPRIKNASLNPEKLYYKAWDDDELYEVIILPDNTVIVQYCYASAFFRLDR